MDTETIENISVILENKKRNFDSLSREIKNIYKKYDLEYLMDDFEHSVKSFKGWQIPRFTFVFFLSLIVLYSDNIDLIAENLKTKKDSLRFLRIACRMFLKGNQGNFKYDGHINHKTYTNKFEIISSFEVNHWGTEFGRIKSLFEIFYHLDQKIFLELIGHDSQYLIYCYFMVMSYLELEYEDLLPFLQSEDEIISNATLFRLTITFQDLFKQYDIKKNLSEDISDIEKKLEKELNHLQDIFSKLKQETAIYLVINFIFGNRDIPINYISLYPSFFLELIEKSDTALVIKNLNRQDLNNLFLLRNLREFIETIHNVHYELLFTHHLIHWLNFNVNDQIWEKTGRDIIKIIQLFTEDIKQTLHEDLLNIRKKLYSSKFDKQVRYNKYLTDTMKEKIINEIVTFH